MTGKIISIKGIFGGITLKEKLFTDTEIFHVAEDFNEMEE